MKVLSTILLVFTVLISYAQYDEIPLLNPSFEGDPAAGTNYRAFLLSGWNDCAPYYFFGQTPPDVQPGKMEFFDVTTHPLDGDTYLGMVTRQNETWELVSQRLAMPLEKSKCYSFEINLSRSETYFSQLLNHVDTTKKFNFNKPIVLRIWGGRNVYEKRELLAESPVIAHTEWRTYAFEFHVKQNHDYLILEAFYKTPTLLPYNGNVLLDKASEVIRQIPCPGEEELIAAIDPEPAEVVEKKVRTDTKTVKSKPKKQPEKQLEEKVDPQPEKRPVRTNPRILSELDKGKLREGQTIKIKQLYFRADSSNFTSDSYQVLDEIFYFLKDNPQVVIEIGGHTNGIPGKQYCQTLSLKRARAVASYLYKKGIREDRIVYKGYGKEKPVASDKTHLGRQKNQRVEIKILKLS